MCVKLALLNSSYSNPQPELQLEDERCLTTSADCVWLLLLDAVSFSNHKICCKCVVVDLVMMYQPVALLQQICTKYHNDVHTYGFIRQRCVANLITMYILMALLYVSVHKMELPAQKSLRTISSYRQLLLPVCSSNRGESRCNN